MPEAERAGLCVVRCPYRPDAPFACGRRNGQKAPCTFLAWMHPGLRSGRQFPIRQGRPDCRIPGTDCRRRVDGRASRMRPVPAASFVRDRRSPATAGQDKAAAHPKARGAGKTPKIQVASSAQGPARRPPCGAATRTPLLRGPPFNLVAAAAEPGCRRPGGGLRRARRAGHRHAGTRAAHRRSGRGKKCSGCVVPYFDDRPLDFT